MATRKNQQTASNVEIIGRLGATVRSRDLPSGDTLTSFTLIIDRPPREQHGAAKVDAIGCTTTSRAIARRLERIEPGTAVAVTGVLRRRFWRSGAAPGPVGSSTEVLVRTLKLA